ncbi:MAG TPA: penicillin-binding protein 1C [Parasegetibacter sp.]
MRRPEKNIRRWLLYPLTTVVALFLLFLLLNWIFPLPDSVEYSTVVTDDKDEIVHAFLTSTDKWRMKVESGDITPLIRKTILAKEDKYFYYHPGVNPVAILRALANNIFKGRRTSGASTITMQVAKMLRPGRRTYVNKAVEMFRAFQLEWKYSKEEILQLYLNLAPYGGNIEGIKSASVLYFDKAPDHLSLAEITTLSIIPNKPSSLTIGRHNDKIIQERNKWLNRFAAEGVFTEKEIQDALAEPLDAYRHKAPAELPHLSLKLKKQSSSPIISTSVNMNTQWKAEKLVSDYVRSLQLKGIQNAAVIIIDNQTHQVVSYIGSADFHNLNDGGQVNGAAAVRQPGSTLKPLLYGICIDEGLLTPKAVITDVPVSYDGYTPENYDKQFNGYVTMEYALEHSLNVPAVKALQQLSIEPMIKSLTDCHFESIRKTQNSLGLSMVLGGCGANLEELTGLFSAFACEGLYYRPVYTKTEKSTTGKRILSSGATYMINEILSKINRPDFPINWETTAKLPKIAWKTGTSYGRRDGWAIGYNKRFTVGVWTGNFSGVGVPGLSGANIATPLLFRIFNTIDYNSENTWFQQPEDCDIRMVCAETGLPPAPHCRNIVTDYFIPLISTTKTCEHQREIAVSPDETISYCKTCQPSTGYKLKWYPVVTPDMQEYFEERKIRYDKIPPHNPGCERIFREGAPVITSPRNGDIYYISRKNPEHLLLRCQTSNDVSRVFWYINNRYYKSAQPGEPVFFAPTEGTVKISCTDDKGRNRNISITVVH